MPAPVEGPIAYGAVPQRAENPQQLRRIAVLAAVVAGCVLVALLSVSSPTGVSKGTDPWAFLAQRTSKLADTDSDADSAHILTKDEQETFLDEAATVLSFLGMSVQKAENHTDLRGFSHHIPFEKEPAVQLTCSYVCLDEIAEVFRVFLQSANQQEASAIACHRTLMHIANVVYGSHNGATVVASDADAMHTESVTDPHVLRAASALQDYVNLERREKCAGKPEFEGSPSVLYDERGTAEDALGQYRLEARLGAGDAEQVFTGRVVHLALSDQLTSRDHHDEDGANLMGRFRVMSIHPDPCAEGSEAALAVTRDKVSRINSQKLSWSAAFRPQHEGVSLSQFGLGAVPPPLAEVQRNTLQMAAGIAEWAPPASLDARDTHEGEEACRAFDILDQGPCGSCYAFAAASAMSARMCLETHRKWNVVLSPQEMMDCDNACEGGWPYYVFRRLASEGGFAVEDFCDPYTAKKEVCCGTCEQGHEFFAVDGSVWYVGGNSVAGVKSMQYELLLNGPGVVGFVIYDDFMTYSGGVYHKSEGAKQIGAHAVSLIGWGTEDGVDYWLLQNSWGKNVGIDGTWKMRRGTDEGFIESWGMAIGRPERPLACPDARCANGGVPLKDCSCRCNGGWAGPTCEECALKCHHGGELAPACKECWCPPGRFGADCSGLVALSSGARCANATDAASPLAVQLSYLEGGAATPPTQGSFIGFYPTDAQYTHQDAAWEFACGWRYDESVNGGRCPREHTVGIRGKGRAPREPGTYKVALVQFKPENEFGQSGYPRLLRDRDVFAMYTVTEACDDDAVEAAAQANDMVPAFKESLAQRRKDLVAQQQDMDARLQAAAAARAALVPSPEMQVVGVDAAEPCVWATGGPLDVCWTLPGDANRHPKHLVLFRGGSDSSAVLKAGLIDAGPDTEAPAEAEGCTMLQLAAAMPAGEYTVALTDKALEKLVSVTLTIATATVSVVGYTEGTTESGAAMLKLHLGWSLPAERASVADKIAVLDARNEVAAWFYTSCKCQGPEGAAPVASGYEFVEIVRSASTVAGGYAIKLYPGGGDVVGDVAQDWVPWEVLGW